MAGTTEGRTGVDNKIRLSDLVKAILTVAGGHQFF
jgi:hypothetical protein